MNFPHITTENRREDVCNKCFIFSERRNHAYVPEPGDDDLSAVSENSDVCPGGSAGVRVYEDDIIGLEVTLDDDDILPPVAAEDITSDAIRDSIRHVRSAKQQRAYLRRKEAEAVEDVKNNVNFSNSHSCFTFDFCMNGEVPHLGWNQPGCTYYWKKYNAFIFGLVNAAHRFTDDAHYGDIGHFMRAYVYPEWEGGKGSDNVASIMLRFLMDEGLMKEDENGEPICGGSLTGFCDNCTGQNKNNTVLRLAAYLVESGYFKEVEIVFLVVGHTKNACDCLFNSLKFGYRNKNVWSFSELLEVLDESYKVKVHKTNHTHFKQWGKHLDEYYKKIVGGVLDKHIFHVDTTCIAENGNHKTVSIKIREADLPDAPFIAQNIKKAGTKNRLKPNSTTPAILPKVIRNPMKKVTYYENWRKLIPCMHHEEMCPEPTPEEWEKGRKGGIKNKRKGTKLQAKQKRKIFDKMEADGMNVDDEIGVGAADVDFREAEDDESDMTPLATLARRKADGNKTLGACDDDKSRASDSDDSDILVMDLVPSRK